MRRVLEYLGYRLLAFAVPLLPRRAMVWLGRRLGGLYVYLSPETRRTGLENLRRVFPDRTDHMHLLRRSLRQQGVALFDALWSGRLTPARARRYLDLRPEQEAIVRDLLSRQKGLLVATGHFGSWEMLNVAGGALGFPPATFIARSIDNPWIERHFRRRREHTGNRLVYREKALLACIAALRRGEIVSSVIDVAILPAQGSTFVDFCGTPALTPVALPVLAVRRGAPLLYVALRPVDKGLRYVPEYEVLEPTAGGDRDAEIRRLGVALNRALERSVRSCPEAWIWSYKRWKYRPSELPGDYPSYSRWLEAVPEAVVTPRVAPLRRRHRGPFRAPPTPCPRIPGRRRPPRW